MKNNFKKVLLVFVFIYASLISSAIASLVDNQIDGSYAIKNMLSVITEAFPALSVQKALQQSVLFGIIFQEEVKLHMYGAFEPVSDPERPGRIIKNFETNTSLNQITRLLLDVLGDQLRPIALPSSPFVGLNGELIAEIITILHQDGIGGLIAALDNQPEKKIFKKKGSPADSGAVAARESLVDRWWDGYGASGVKGIFSQKSKFVAKILGHSKKELEKEASFVELLEHLAEEARSDRGSVESLSKIFMTFLYLKDQKERSTVTDVHSIQEYYESLLKKSFEIEYYSKENLENINEALFEDDAEYALDLDPKGIEDVCFYLAHFINGNFPFLQAPFGTYMSKTKSFPYCVESVIRSIVNLVLYNPETELLDVTMLSMPIQEAMKSKNPRFYEFIIRNANPKIVNYYKNTIEEWLTIISGLENVVYVEGDGPSAYNISATAGPDNIFACLENLFGVSCKSFDDFIQLFSLKDPENKTIRDVLCDSKQFPIDLRIIYPQKHTITSEIFSRKGDSHASFVLEKGKIIDLFDSDIFYQKINLFCDYSGYNLYQIIFKPSTLNVIEADEAPTPLLKAIQKDLNVIVRTMLRCGADVNFKGSCHRSPLEEAIIKKNDTIVRLLLDYHACVTKVAVQAACKMENVDILKFLLAIFEKKRGPLDYNRMLLEASRSKSLEVVQFLVNEKGADSNFKDRSLASPLFYAIEKDSYPIVEFLITHGADVNTFQINGMTSLAIAIWRKIENQSLSMTMIDYLLEKKASLHLMSFDRKKELMSALVEKNAVDFVDYLLVKGIFSPEELLVQALEKQTTQKFKKMLIEHSMTIPSEFLIKIVCHKKLKSKEKKDLCKLIIHKTNFVDPIVIKTLEEDDRYENYDRDSFNYLKKVIEQQEKDDTLHSLRGLFQE